MQSFRMRLLFWTADLDNALVGVGSSLGAHKGEGRAYRKAGYVLRSVQFEGVDPKDSGFSLLHTAEIWTRCGTFA